MQRRPVRISTVIWPATPSPDVTNERKKGGKMEKMGRMDRLTLDLECVVVVLIVYLDAG